MRRALLLSLPCIALLALACADEDLLPSPTPRARAVAPAATSGAKAVATASPKAIPGLPSSVDDAERTGPSRPSPRPSESSKLLAPVPFPAGLAVIIETGCTACDGPMTGLVRVYRTPRGTLQVETLLATPSRGLGRFIGRPLVGDLVPAPIIEGRSTSSARGIVIAECRASRCGTSGISQQVEEEVLLRSLDGGVTWTELGRLPVMLGQRPVAFFEDEILLTHGGLEGQPPKFTQHFTRFPSGRSFAEPPDLDYPFPVLSTRNDLLWRDRNGAFRWQSGRRPPDLGNGGVRAGLIDAIAGRQALAFGWVEGEPRSEYMWGAIRYQGISTDVEVRYRSATLIWPGAYPVGGAERWFVGAVDSPGSPVRQAASFDTETGEIQVFTFDGDDKISARRVVAAYAGPFARATRVDACTEVRSAPSASAAVLECAANGVLFQRGAPPTVDGAWLGVTTPAGVEGWAETRHLEW